jgi:hypothetical protein
MSRGCVQRYTLMSLDSRYRLAKRIILGYRNACSRLRQHGIAASGYHFSLYERKMIAREKPATLELTQAMDFIPL